MWAPQDKEAYWNYWFLVYGCVYAPIGTNRLRRFASASDLVAA